MKVKFVFFIMMSLLLLLSACNVNQKYSIAINKLQFIKNKSSYSLNKRGSQLVFSTYTYLKNPTRSPITFHIKFIFRNPILKKQYEKGMVLGKRELGTAFPFKQIPGKSGPFGGEYKIKGHLTKSEINKIKLNPKIIIFDDKGHKRVLTP